MKRSNYIVAAAILLLSTASLQAQQPKTSSGAYITYVADQIVGTDTYTLTTNADGSAEAQAEVSFGTTKFKTITRTLRNKPVSFTREADGAPLLSVEFGNGRSWCWLGDRDRWIALSLSRR